MNKLRYTPHELAPMFHNDDFDLILNQVVNEVSSGNFTVNDRFKDVVRQCGFVNLWFFLKYIAGHSGPFNLLNETLHVNMCNFRQDMMVPGRKAAAFTSRGMYKTTIFTKGAPAWGLLREPNLRIETFSCIEGRAKDFFRSTREIFDSNELFTWLYPEYVPANNQARWNDSEFVLPNRTRKYTEPSLRPHGVGCNTQGIHGDWLVIDDPIGEAQLNSERDANADMVAIANWLKSNIEAGTLVISHRTSQVFYTATRYGLADAHSFIFDNIREIYGYWDTINQSDVDIGENNEWHVYNRSAIENGVVTLPEVYTKEKLEDMKKNQPWTYYTQVENDVTRSGLNELNEYVTKGCKVICDDDFGYLISVSDQTIKLKDTYVVIPCDPGATEGRQTSRTSKSAVVVLARDAYDRRFIIGLKSGYAKASEVFNWVYGYVIKYYNYYQKAILEAQGGFKLLEGVWRDYLRVKQNEAIRNNDPVYNMHFVAQGKTGEKRAVIRNTLEPLLKSGLLYVEASIKDQIDRAIRRFPSGGLDVLDAICLGDRGTIKPLTRDELEYEREKDRRFKERKANCGGY